MGYSVGDKVEIKDPNYYGHPGKIWELWLTEIIPMKHKTDDQTWHAEFTRRSHSSIIPERYIIRKISSGFKGFK